MKGELPHTWQGQPCTEGMLSVDSPHHLYWRTYGKKELQPVLFLHGGPGSGVDISSLSFFDPGRHFVVLFDQRGAGQSTPSGSILDNTTQHLIADIEALRITMGIPRWIVFGGSWGATLGLLYGQYHPSSCVGLVLRGVSNSHVFQNRWMLEERPQLMPDRHQAFMKSLDAKQRSNPVKAHYDNIRSDDVDRQLQALNAINVLESGMSHAQPEPIESCVELSADELGGELFNRAKIYLHYWFNEKFIGENQCLPDPSALGSLPVIFLHGESDWICPLSGAQEIRRALPRARLISVPGAGHSPFHPELTKALQQALVELEVQA